MKVNEGGSAKANRVNAAKIKRDAAKKTLLSARRGMLLSGVVNGTAATAVVGNNGEVMSSLGGMSMATLKAMTQPAPRVVGIISLSENEEGLEEMVRGILMSGADKSVVVGGGSGGGMKSVTVSYGAHQKVRRSVLCC